MLDLSPDLDSGNAQPASAAIGVGQPLGRAGTLTGGSSSCRDREKALARAVFAVT
jgi:hypothetical protein